MLGPTHCYSYFNSYGQQEEKGMTEDEMVGWHHRLHGCEFGQPLGGGEGQGSLVCHSPWGRIELDMTEQLSNKRELDFVRSHDLVSDTCHLTFKLSPLNLNFICVTRVYLNLKILPNIFLVYFFKSSL